MNEGGGALLRAWRTERQLSIGANYARAREMAVGEPELPVGWADGSCYVNETGKPRADQRYCEADNYSPPKRTKPRVSRMVILRVGDCFRLSWSRVAGYERQR